MQLIRRTRRALQTSDSAVVARSFRNDQIEIYYSILIRRLLGRTTSPDVEKLARNSTSPSTLEQDSLNRL